MDIKTGEIFSTTDYSKFKYLDSNRPITSSRINKIVKSVHENGYVRNPIIVNEDFFVIDGQARSKAFQVLHIPIEYCIAEGAGRDECIALNAFTTPWSLIDYIESYATDSEDYKRALLLADEFSDLKLKVVLNAINKTVWKESSDIKTGKLKCSLTRYEEAHAMLEYASEFAKVLKEVKGNKDRIYTAIMFCYGHEDIDNDKLLKKVSENISLLNNTTDMKSVNRCLETIYNYNNKKNHVYIESDYEKYLEGKYSWYAKKYGSKKGENNE